MLAESLAALAAAGGTAVVQAAGTDAWAMVRERLARLVGRGDTGREAVELERLDQTGRALVGDAGPGSAEVVRWESAWQMRLELFLDGLAEQEQTAAAAELRQLVADARAAGRAVHAGEGGVAAGGEVSVQASQQSVAGAVVRVEGGIHLTPFATDGPPQPFPPTAERGPAAGPVVPPPAAGGGRAVVAQHGGWAAGQMLVEQLVVAGGCRSTVGR